MNEEEFESIAMLIEHLESARIYAGAMFEKYCNKGNYDRAIIFSGLRDRLGVEVQTVKSYIVVNKEFEDIEERAVQHCTNIPQEIKDKAFDECIKLGFSPYMN